MSYSLESEFNSQTWDCLILVHSDIHVLEAQSRKIQGHGITNFNLSKGLSNALLVISTRDRSSYSQQWLMDTLVNIPDCPILCIYLDLLFEPSFEIDQFALFRRMARVKRLIVLWPGDFASNILSYATPNHHHYRTWKISEDLLLHPIINIRQLPDIKGA